MLSQIEHPGLCWLRGRASHVPCLDWLTGWLVCSLLPTDANIYAASARMRARGKIPTRTPARRTTSTRYYSVDRLDSRSQCHTGRRVQGQAARRTRWAPTRGTAAGYWSAALCLDSYSLPRRRPCPA
jgi:hypothetical protein